MDSSESLDEKNVFSISSLTQGMVWFSAFFLMRTATCHPGMLPSLYVICVFSSRNQADLRAFEVSSSSACGEIVCFITRVTDFGVNSLTLH